MKIVNKPKNQGLRFLVMAKLRVGFFAASLILFSQSARRLNNLHISSAALGCNF